MCKRHWIMPLLLFVLLSPAAGSLLAQSEGNISKQQAIAIVQQQYPGRVLSVQRQGNSYRVKSLDNNGKVRVISVDAATGQVLSGK